MEVLLTLLRVAISLAVVVALVWFAHRRISRSRSSQRNPMAVVARQGVGSKASVVVIDLDGERLLLGVTEHQVNLLRSAPVPDAAPQPVENARAFAGALERASTGGDDLGAAITVGPWGRSGGIANPMLAGSILSPDTWRRAVAALRR